MRNKVKDENKRKLHRRALRVRKKVNGSAERPRLSVFRSAKHIYAQIIDDDTSTTLVTASTQSKELAEALKGLKKAAKAEKVGAKIAELAKQKGIEAVVFDRNGRPYHGRIAALAKGARDAGLKF
jgi:large subunit ribosomal protein L18